MTVVDKHTCSSPVVIKLGAICAAADVKVDRLEFFVIFLSWDVHNKIRAYVRNFTYLRLYGGVFLKIQTLRRIFSKN